MLKFNYTHEIKDRIQYQIDKSNESRFIKYQI